jgi:membrane associated rhomboid family serine protease
MLPIKSDVPLRGFPFITIGIICCCCLSFFLQMPFLARRGLVPLDFVYTVLHPSDGLFGSAGILVSSFFLHGGLLHLLGNIWYLWLFGSRLEGTIGPFRFVLIYFMSGIAAMITQVANDPLSTIPIIGASGAIAGCMGRYLVQHPLSRIILGIPPIFTIRLYAVLFLLLWFWLQWNSMLSSHPSANRIAWWAHIGGFCFGMLSGLLYRLFPPGSKVKQSTKTKRTHR